MKNVKEVREELINKKMHGFFADGESSIIITDMNSKYYSVPACLSLVSEDNKIAVYSKHDRDLNNVILSTNIGEKRENIFVSDNLHYDFSDMFVFVIGEISRDDIIAIGKCKHIVSLVEGNYKNNCEYYQYDAVFFMAKREGLIVITTMSASSFVHDKMCFDVDYENIISKSCDYYDLDIDYTELSNEWKDVKKLGGYDKVKAMTNAEVKKIDNKWCGRLKKEVVCHEDIPTPNLDAGMVL